jgi:hypothetical protein
MHMWPGYINYVLFALNVAMQTLITALPVPPFLYRYLVICRDIKLSTREILFIYLAFATPTLIYIPLNIYLNVKYDDWSTYLPRSNCLNPMSINSLLFKLDQRSNVKYTKWSEKNPFSACFHTKFFLSNSTSFFPCC